MSSFRINNTRNLFSVVFVRDGNVLFAVLPFCVVNCAVLVAVEYIEQYIKLSFSPTGHGLMTLLVSFLVISKVNLTYERFRLARHSVGSALLRLRELNQLVITLVEANYYANDQNDTPQNDNTSSDNNNDNDKSVEAKDQELVAARLGRDEWKAACMDQTIAILDATKEVLQSSELAKALARNEGSLAEKHAKASLSSTNYNKNNSTDASMMIDDPMELVQALRLHLYVTGAEHDIQLLERLQLLTKLGEFVSDYRSLIDLASTPLPFSLIQMGRAFLFIWTFSMPLVLRQGPFSDIWSAMIFLFFLTYGFIGLELVAMQLATPFGDGPNDIRVTALCNATVTGMARDVQIADNVINKHHATTGVGGGGSTVRNRRFLFATQKSQRAAASASAAAAAGVGVLGDRTISDNTHDEYSVYHSMPFGA